MAPYWSYLHWVAFGAGGMVAWRYLPLAAARIVAICTHSDQRARRSLEIIRLTRRDAPRIRSYLPESEPEDTDPPDNGQEKPTSSPGQSVQPYPGPRHGRSIRYLLRWLNLWQRAAAHHGRTLDTKQEPPLGPDHSA
jgi:hypothetical protein